MYAFEFRRDRKREIELRSESLWVLCVEGSGASPALVLDVVGFCICF